jgi:hypothetical protein
VKPISAILLCRPRRCRGLAAAGTNLLTPYFT